jgi:predicted aspartyl protease
MKWFAAAALVFISWIAGLSARPADKKNPPALETADALFKAGKFAEAEKLYPMVAARHPKQYWAAGRLGYIALLSNHLAEAQQWLEKALTIQADQPALKSLLAEVYYRRDDFQKAAPILRGIGQAARAKQLASFKGQKPYEVHGRASKTSLKFIMTDLLPLVQVRVNGGAAVNFFIDTGAGEVVLDRQFARELKVPEFGAEKGTFAGGKQASSGYGRIDSLTLGGWVVKNVPVGILDTRQFSKPVFGGKRVDGILGTVLFYHFLTTLHYPRGELILRRKAADSRRGVEKAGVGKVITVPFWMAGDHFMVAFGRINHRPPVLLFVDTGAAELGAVLAASAIKDAGIKLREDQAGEGVGGGGKVRSVPFVVKELSLGPVRERNVPGAFQGPFRFEHVFDFRIAGIISHQFFRPYALTFDFGDMRLLLKRGS